MTTYIVTNRFSSDRTIQNNTAARFCAGLSNQYVTALRCHVFAVDSGQKRIHGWSFPWVLPQQRCALGSISRLHPGIRQSGGFPHFVNHAVDAQAAFRVHANPSVFGFGLRSLHISVVLSKTGADCKLGGTTCGRTDVVKEAERAKGMSRRRRMKDNTGAIVGIAKSTNT